jgi:hypothetical protein
MHEQIALAQDPPLTVRRVPPRGPGREGARGREQPAAPSAYFLSKISSGQIADTA